MGFRDVVRTENTLANLLTVLLLSGTDRCFYSQPCFLHLFRQLCRFDFPSVESGELQDGCPVLKHARTPGKVVVRPVG